MKNKWDQRVYLDLYSGAGYSRIAGTSMYMKGSPLIALAVDRPFDKYIFCEEDHELMEALKARVKRQAPGSNVVFVSGGSRHAANAVTGPNNEKNHRLRR